MDEKAIDSIRKRAERAIADAAFPGCVIGIAHAEGRTVLPFGTFTYDAHAPLVEAGAAYDLASVTKSIPTASLALALSNEGALHLDDRVSLHIPELHNDFGATIEDLLRYRVHGAALSKIRARTFEEVRTYALEHGFDAPPGESAYTNLPAYILGMIIERVGGATLAELGHRYFFEPLGMDSTTFFPSAFDCAPTEIDGRGEVRGLPHDESAYKFAVARRSAGHAGLFSTAPDLLHFLEALLAGTYPYLIEGAQAGLGWQIEGDFLGSHPGAGSFGKTGFTGTSVLADPERSIAVVILSNRTYPKRPADSSAINAFRRDVADIISFTS